MDQYNWKEINFPASKKYIGKSLNQTISQLFLMFYMSLIILKEKDMHINQNIT